MDLGASPWWEITDYLHDGSEALGALIISVTGAFAWLFQNIFNAASSLHKRDSGYRRQCINIREVISIDVFDYEKTFTENSKKETINTIWDLYSQGNLRPLITAEAQSSIAKNQIQDHFNLIPEECIKHIAEYFASEAMFSASYKGLSNKDIVEAGPEVMIRCVEETYNDAFLTIEKGHRAIEQLDLYVAKNKWDWLKYSAIAAITAVIFLWVAYATLIKPT